MLPANQDNTITANQGRQVPVSVAGSEPAGLLFAPPIDGQGVAFLLGHRGAYRASLALCGACGEPFWSPLTTNGKPFRRRYCSIPCANLGKRRVHTWKRIQKRANRIVENAIASGRLHRELCEVCHARIGDAHHDDYTKPLQVRWQCKLCHNRLHHLGKTHRKQLHSVPSSTSQARVHQGVSTVTDDPRAGEGSLT